MRSISLQIVCHNYAAATGRASVASGELGGISAYFKAIDDSNDEYEEEGFGVQLVLKEGWSSGYPRNIPSATRLAELGIAQTGHKIVVSDATTFAELDAIPTGAKSQPASLERRGGATFFERTMKIIDND